MCFAVELRSCHFLRLRNDSEGYLCRIGLRGYLQGVSHFENKCASLIRLPVGVVSAWTVVLPIFSSSDVDYLTHFLNFMIFSCAVYCHVVPRVGHHYFLPHKLSPPQSVCIRNVVALGNLVST